MSSSNRHTRHAHKELANSLQGGTSGDGDEDSGVTDGLAPAGGGFATLFDSTADPFEQAASLAAGNVSGRSFTDTVGLRSV
jgi:hypothetical protein